MSDRHAQTIFRNASADKPYSMILNAALQDVELTPEAGWLLVFMLSQPRDWGYNLIHVAKHRRMGRDRVQAAVRELRDRQYCKRIQLREKGGQAAGYEYLFTDEPGRFSTPEPDLQVSVKQEPEQPAPVKPEPDLQAPYKRKTGKRMKGTKRESAPAVFLLSMDWTLPDAWRSWALKEAPEHARLIENDAKKFRAHWRGKSRLCSEAEWEGEWQKWWLRTTTRAPSAAATNKPHWRDVGGGVTIRDTSVPFKVELAERAALGDAHAAKLLAGAR